MDTGYENGQRGTATTGWYLSASHLTEPLGAQQWPEPSLVEEARQLSPSPLRLGSRQHRGLRRVTPLFSAKQDASPRLLLLLKITQDAIQLLKSPFVPLEPKCGKTTAAPRKAICRLRAGTPSELLQAGRCPGLHVPSAAQWLPVSARSPFPH